MGGVVAAQVAEQIPDRIRAIVSVASSEPPDGASMLQMIGGTAPEYLSELVWSSDRRTASITPAGVRNFLYNLCSPDVTDQAISRFKPQPVAPYETAIRITPEGYGRVPRFYIGCRQDRVVGDELQRRMCNALAADRIYSIEADHSPFFSASHELTACLERIAQSV
jgi:pimeloyl-ACP methyl ester carboxylesterase